MSLSFTGPRRTVEHRWLAYALLCDNVLHHLENGRASPDFAVVHLAAQALGGRVRRGRGHLEFQADPSGPRLVPNWSRVWAGIHDAGPLLLAAVAEGPK